MYGWVASRSSISLSFATTFFAFETSDIFVLGSDGKLWFEHAQHVIDGTFGQIPPPREQVDANVAAFQPLFDPSVIYVMGTDRKLWLEHSVNGAFGQVPPPRQQVDATVQSFQALDTNTICILGTDGKLWMASGPFGSVPPKRQQVDADVVAFQVIDATTVCVLGSNGNLWLEYGPFGTVPPKRDQIDANVAAFQMIDIETAYVLGTNGNLWLEHGPFAIVPPKRQQVDANVAAFQGMDANTAFILGSDANLWLVHGPFGHLPPPRQVVDANVEDFQALDANTIYILGTDANLWLEHAPFGNIPPRREQVDGNVGQPLGFGTLRPAYQVLTVVYAPPGTNGGKSTSSVDYSSGSSTGTTTSATSSFKDGVDVSASVGADVGAASASASVDFSFSQTTTNSSSVESKKSQSFDIKVSGPAADGINHGNDLIYLWLNPLATITVDRRNHINWRLGIDGTTMLIQYVAVDWLKSPATMPAGVKAQLDAAGFTALDYDKIIAANPFANGQTTIDTNRFAPLSQSFPYEPPVHSTDPVPTQTFTMQSSVTDTKTHTSQVQYSVSVTVSAGLKAPFTASLKVTDSFQWTNTASSSTATGTTQSASVTVGGPAFGYTGPTDVLVYWDMIYNSFLFTFPATPASAMGLIVDAQGKPYANQPVTLTAGGGTFTSFTDARGQYRFYNAATGSGTVSAGGKTFPVTIGQTAAQASLHLA